MFKYFYRRPNRDRFMPKKMNAQKNFPPRNLCRSSRKTLFRSFFHLRSGFCLFDIRSSGRRNFSANWNFLRRPKTCRQLFIFLVQWCLTPKWWVSVRTSSSGPLWLPTLTSLALLRSCVVMKQHQRKHWVRCRSTVPLVFVSLAHFESFLSSLALSQ